MTDHNRSTVLRASHVMIAICAAAAGSSPAHAEVRDPRDGHEDGWVVVGGVAEDHDRGVVDAAVVSVAREVGWSLPREPMTAQDTQRLLDCSDPDRPLACVPPAIARRGIRRIFVFALDRKQADSGAPMVVITARLLVVSPPALVVRQRFCEHCADDRLGEASTELARQLLRDLAVRRGRTILDVESSPSGARITLDGRPVGATNATFNTFPGSHVVVIDKAGYRSEARTVVASEGRTAEVAVTLVPADRTTPAGHSSILVSGMLVGGGLLAIIAGGVLLDLGTRGGPHDRYRYAGATPAGAVIGSVGVAACGIGVYVWWRVPGAGSVPSGIPAGVPASAPAGAAFPTAATASEVIVGWATRF